MGECRLVVFQLLVVCFCSQKSSAYKYCWGMSKTLNDITMTNLSRIQADQSKRSNASRGRRRAKYLRQSLCLHAEEKLAAQCLAVIKAALQSLLLAKGHNVAQVNCIWRLHNDSRISCRAGLIWWRAAQVWRRPNHWQKISAGLHQLVPADNFGAVL